MAIAEPTTTKMTVEEFLLIADEEGTHRELIDGELREYDVTTRNPRHSVAIACTTFVLRKWLKSQSQKIGVIACGDARCQLNPELETVVGIDVAYFAGEEAIRQFHEEPYFSGPPTLAVEVLSSSDVHEDVIEKSQKYLAVETKMLWIVDPDLQTVMILKPNAEPVLFNKTQRLTALDELPGFDVAVSELFEP